MSLYYFLMFYMLVPKIEICPQYFLNKFFHKRLNSNCVQVGCFKPLRVLSKNSFEDYDIFFSILQDKISFLLVAFFGLI